MGYYTRYNLTYELPNEQENEKYKRFFNECRKANIAIPDELIKAMGVHLLMNMQIQEAMDAEDACEYGSITDLLHYPDECRWYGHEDDLRAFSARFPNVLFTLKGEGEESGDLWVKYFMDGKMQDAHANITFDDFNESKLK